MSKRNKEHIYSFRNVFLVQYTLTQTHIKEMKTPIQRSDFFKVQKTRKKNCKY